MNAKKDRQTIKTPIGHESEIKVPLNGVQLNDSAKSAINQCGRRERGRATEAVTTTKRGRLNGKPETKRRRYERFYFAYH